jgi:hypothetical protein
MPAARGLPASTREVCRLYGRVVSDAAQKVAGSAPQKHRFSREFPLTITSGATEYSDWQRQAVWRLLFDRRENPDYQHTHSGGKVGRECSSVSKPRLAAGICIPLLAYAATMAWHIRSVRR